MHTCCLLLALLGVLAGESPTDWSSGGGGPSGGGGKMSLQLGMYVPLPLLVLPAAVCCQLPPLLLPAGHSMLPGSPVPPVALLEDVAVREEEFIIIMVGKADVGKGGSSGGGEGS